MIIGLQPLCDDGRLNPVCGRSGLGFSSRFKHHEHPIGLRWCGNERDRVVENVREPASSGFMFNAIRHPSMEIGSAEACVKKK
jgi:hypothetical protein